MRIFHIATVADWEAARACGAYTTSTRGRTLADEGYLHAAHRTQVRAVFDRYYADVTEPLVLLTIETERLGVPWRDEAVGEETYPHIYGPLSPQAVVGVATLDARGATRSFSSLFFADMGLRAGLVLVAMLLAGVGSRIGLTVDRGYGELLGALVGLAVGVTLMVVVLRRR